MTPHSAAAHNAPSCQAAAFTDASQRRSEAAPTSVCDRSQWTSTSSVVGVYWSLIVLSYRSVNYLLPRTLRTGDPFLHPAGNAVIGIHRNTVSLRTPRETGINAKATLCGDRVV